MTEFRIQAGALRQVVTQAGAVRATASLSARRVPVLHHVRLTATAGALQATGCNLDTRIVATATGDGDLAPITVSAGRLAALLTHIPPETTVEIAPEDTGQLRVVAGALTARLYTLPAEDFPDWAEPMRPDAVPVTLQAGVLLRLFDRTVHALSIDETRYYLNGIYLHRNLGALRAVATDGHRLFVAEEAYPAEANTIPPAIVRRHDVRLLREALRRLPPEAAVTWIQGTTRLALIARSWRLDCKPIDGTFPNYATVIPVEDGAPIVVQDPRALSRIVTAASVSDERARRVVLSNGSGTTLHLKVAAPGTGDCTIAVAPEVAAWASDAEHPTFGVNARYLRDLCGALPGGFTMRVQSGAEPLHIRGAEGVAVLMPMRI